MRHSRPNTAQRLMCGAAAIAILSCAGIAHAEEQRAFAIQPQSLSTALAQFGAQSGHPVMAPMDLLGSKTTRGFSDSAEPTIALAQLLDGTGLTFTRAGDTFAIVRASDPQSGSAAGDGADSGTVQALIVTAQKREENIQDVPIAMSAFTQEALERSQVAGGPDLMTQVPNMTFTKTNFTGYSIQIRGIGTQAISATTDNAVAVAFNNTPFIRNRFFEQEFYDLQRVEVLRGPQGTLYGRNATAGVVNLISQKPKFTYEAKLSADVSNYSSTRLEGMVNVPLVEDKVALRLAGAWTKREGFATNQLTGAPIDGRDLWSTRVSLRFAPTDRIDANLIWEHFKEDDDRLRSAKQVCDKDVVTEFTAIMPNGDVVTVPTTMTTPLPVNTVSQTWTGVQGTFSLGCAPASIYAPESYQTPNGLSLPYVHPLKGIGVPINTADPYFDPYASTSQSRDLRVIESTVEPRYQADADLVELQFSADLTDTLTLTSETAYSVDTIFSTQDYNRFNTASGVFLQPDDILAPRREGVLLQGPNGGIFCDPQIGCADRLVAADLATARSRQFSQELRLSSSFDGPFNFSLGANFLRYDTEDKYYVFINTLGLYSAATPYLPGGNGGFNTSLSPYVAGVTDNSECMKYGFGAPDPSQIQTVNGCEYMDPNPIGSLNDRGHNYFLSKNPYKLISYAVFGESYYQVADNLKVTAGLRWTVDKKEAPRIPSWILAADTVGYPVAEVVEQEWREPTGRLAIDWKPDLSFTDETLLYASFAHGYKAGGMNPPAAGVVCYFGCGGSTELAEKFLEATHPKTFRPEFINAYEVGTKNTLADGRLTINAAAFYYDYSGYQISQIVNRAAVNHNFDATVWGLEIEADWRPLENLRFGFKGGYEKTRVADGEEAVDVMDRTAGDPNWVVVRPFPTFPSNCIVPAWLFVADVPGTLADVGARGTGAPGPCELAYVMGVDPITGLSYVANPTLFNGVDALTWRPGYPGWNPATAPNAGAGIAKPLGGNELPNAPHWTATLTADYTVPLPNEWLMTLHTDLYYQAESWWRIFNTPGYDKLKAYTNVNLAAIFTNEDAGWKVMAYVKNLLNRDNITGAFLNSDDTGLTTNVFMNEPRLFGLRVTKDFTGGPWWTGADPSSDGPFPLTVELGGQVQRHDAPYQSFAPSFAEAFSSPLGPPEAIQNRNLDWGDGREIKLTWKPGHWAVSAAMRYGRTNNDTHYFHAEADTPTVCPFPAPLNVVCDPSSPMYITAGSSQTDFADMSERQGEEHQIAEFAVGRDFAIGSLESTGSLGLRHAEFKSIGKFDLSGLPDWYFPEGAAILPSHYHRYDASFNATREFEGAGPILSWAAAQTLLGDHRTGRLSLDWSVTGGVLIGKQRTVVEGEESVAYHRGRVHPTKNTVPLVGTPVVTPISTVRSKTVNAPLLDLDLGLSYQAGRIKVGAGYRWERYFDVLDVGTMEAEKADRTMDGPYFKIAVGFGS